MANLREKTPQENERLENPKCPNMTMILVGLWLKSLVFRVFPNLFAPLCLSLISSGQQSSCQIQIQMIIRQSSKSHQLDYHQIVICLVITYFSHRRLDFSILFILLFLLIWRLKFSIKCGKKTLKPHIK